MGQFIQDSLIKIRENLLVNSNFKMATNILVSGIMIWDMDKEFIYMKMEKFIKVFINIFLFLCSLFLYF